MFPNGFVFVALCSTHQNVENRKLTPIKWCLTFSRLFTSFWLHIVLLCAYYFYSLHSCSALVMNPRSLFWTKYIKPIIIIKQIAFQFTWILLLISGRALFTDFLFQFHAQVLYCDWHANEVNRPAKSDSNDENSDKNYENNGIFFVHCYYFH